MSTIFRRALKLSPVFLSASLFANSTHASQSIPDQAAAANNSQLAATVELTVEPLVQLPQTQAVASNSDATRVSDPTAAATVEFTSESVTHNQLRSDIPSSGAKAGEAGEEKEEIAPMNATGYQLPQTPAEETTVFQLTPSNASPSTKRANSILAQQVPAADNTTSDPSSVLEQIRRYSAESSSNTLDQVTNVSQLSDVKPRDWAYEALRSLVERYGCIAGYPDGTFRGNRAMTRYEFAAGLNACLQQVERLIASSTSEFVTKNDLETLQRLINEFKTELTTLGARVDKLEGRVALLEDHQFSTTTKLSGEAIFAISDLFGNQDAKGNDYSADETVFQNRARLAFDTSFTGKDRLRTRLSAGNIVAFGPLTSSSTPGSNITREGRFSFEGNTNNNVTVDKLFYRFPLGNLATVNIFATGADYNDFVPLLNNDLQSDSRGSISRFGRYSPIYRMGGRSAGAGVTLGTKSPVRLDLGYLADEAPNPSEGAGLFDGNYSALAQLTFQPSSAFSLAATYVHSYDSSNLRHGTGSIASQVNTGRPVVGNSYGIEASYAFTPKFVLSGWAGYTNATVIGTGNADIWHYAATLGIKDVGRPGSLLGFVVGMEPKLTGSDATVGALLPGGRRRDPDTGLHVEGFYRFAVNKNIAITPGIIWLTAPGHNEANDDIVIGTIRTTFSF